MKSTTFQQKLIFYAKVFACAIVLGVLGWLSFAPSIIPLADATADVTVSVTIAATAPNVDVTEPGDGSSVGKDIPIQGTYTNIDRIDGVYLKKNGEIVAQLDSSGLTLGSDGTVSGLVSLPDDLESGEYELVVVGHTKDRGQGGNEFPETVETVVTINYTNDSPDISCVYNEGSSCLPGQPEQGFGDEDKETVIVIEGSNFDDDTTVMIGDQECENITVSSDGKKITCTVPKAKEGQTGAQNIVVCVAGKGCGVMVGGFVYRKPLPSVPGTGPSVPSTGLFRIGDTVVTVKDIVWWTGLMIILVVAIALAIIVKSPTKETHYKVGGNSKFKQGGRSQKSKSKTKVKGKK